MPIKGHEEIRFPDLTVPERLLVVAPHPDDQLLSAGLIQRVRAQGGEAVIVNLTSGDGNNPFSIGFVGRRGFNRHPQRSINYGYYRQIEDQAVHIFAGGLPHQLFFLGYPDGGLWDFITRAKNGDRSPVTSRFTGVSAVPYDTAFRPGAPFTMRDVVDDLTQIMSQFKPDLIVAPHPNDHHPDHAASYYFAVNARKQANMQAIDILNPIDHYATDFPQLLRRDQIIKPTRENIPSFTVWKNLALTEQEIEGKIKMTSMYPSQMAWEHPTVDIYTGRLSYLYGITGKNELYGYVHGAVENKAYRERRAREVLIERGLGAVGTTVTDLFRKFFGFFGL